MSPSPSSDVPATRSILEAENPLPALKGAPLSVLLALGRFGPMGRKSLIRRTGWKKDAITAALKDLVALGLVVRRHHRCWVLALSLPALLGLAGAAECGDGKGSCADVGPQQERLGRPAKGRRKRSSPKRGDRSAAVEGAANAGGADGAPGQGRPQRPSHGRQNRSQAGDGRLLRSSSGGAGDGRDNRCGPGEKGREKRSMAGQGPPYRPWRAARDRAARERAARERRGRFYGDGERFSRLSSLPYAAVMNDHDDDLKQHKQKIIHSLQTLSTPFDNAEQWLESVPPPLVEAWLGYFQGLTPQRQRQIRNPAGFIRAKVNAGQRPPAELRASARSCLSCERTHFDSAGQCLVCAGVVMV